MGRNGREDHVAFPWPVPWPVLMGEGEKGEEAHLHGTLWDPGVEPLEQWRDVN